MLSVVPSGGLQRRPAAVLMKVAVCLTVLVGILALNLDGGRTMDERRRVQAAADAAALAAGGDLYANDPANHGTDPGGSARAAAIAAAAANGYPASAVTVNIPPTAGTFAGQAGHIEVRIATSLNATFGTIFTGDPVAVAARSVGRGLPMPIGITLLRGSGANAFRNTAVAFALVNKPLIVDSNDAAAFNSSGPVMASLSRISVTGGAVNSSLLSISRIRTGQDPVLDPLAFLPVPDSAAAPVRSATPLTINSIIPTVLQPGVYRGGIRVTGVSVVTMQPGTYIMEGGGFAVDGVGVVLGLGVMVYNTTSSTFPAGSISVSSLGAVTLTAPLSGPYQGLNFFQNRSMTQPVSMTGAGTTAITGTVYAAKGPVNLTGLAAVGLDVLGGAYVADSMTVSGVGGVTINLGLNTPRVPDVRLVE